MRQVMRDGFTVGRGIDCDWVLIDPENIVSGKHFSISEKFGSYALTDNSTNGVFHNFSAERIPKGGTVTLRNGDRLSLANYEISVSVSMDAGEASGQWGHESGLKPHPMEIEKDRFGIADQRSPISNRMETGTEYVDLPHVHEKPAVVRTGEIDFDFRKEWISHSNTRQADTQKAESSPPSGRADSQKGAESSASLEADGNEVLKAFLHAAGLEEEAFRGADPSDVMRRAGKTYRLFVEGAQRLLEIRAKFKAEFRIDRTQLGFLPTNNNPLKVFMDADAATLSLLSPRQGNFMSGEAAVAEIFRQIEEHQLAATVGMNEALATLLRCFDPKTLRAKVEQQSVAKNLAKGGIRAACWEYFTEEYEVISEESRIDFAKRLGIEFAKAYNDQVDLMNRSGNNKND
ncbi:FHA domain protein [Azospirillum sp. RU38E]|nr:FHA domain protein [Azospirillum sp. RU38E]